MTLWDILLSAALQHVRANGQHAIHPKVRRFSQNDRLRNVSLDVGAHLERIRAKEKNQIQETAAGRYTGSRTCREVGASLSLMFSESDVENLENRKETPVEKMQTTENGEPKKRRRIKMSYSLALAFFVFFGFHFKHLREENVVDGLKKHILIL